MGCVCLGDVFRAARRNAVDANVTDTLFGTTLQPASDRWRAVLLRGAPAVQTSAGIVCCQWVFRVCSQHSLRRPKRAWLSWRPAAAAGSMHRAWLRPIRLAGEGQPLQPPFCCAYGMRTDGQRQPKSSRPIRNTCGLLSNLFPIVWNGRCGCMAICCKGWRCVPWHDGKLLCNHGCARCFMRFINSHPGPASSSMAHTIALRMNLQSTSVCTVTWQSQYCTCNLTSRR